MYNCLLCWILFKITFSRNNVTCCAAITPTSLALLKYGCIICDTSSYNYTLNIPSTASGTIMVNNTAVANQSGALTLNGSSGTYINGNTSYGKRVNLPKLYFSVLF